MLLAEQTTGEGLSHSELPLLVLSRLRERNRAWRLRQYALASANLRDFRSRQNHHAAIVRERTTEDRHRFIYYCSLLKTHNPAKRPDPGQKDVFQL